MKISHFPLKGLGSGLLSESTTSKFPENSPYGMLIKLVLNLRIITWDLQNVFLRLFLLYLVTGRTVGVTHQMLSVNLHHFLNLSNSVIKNKPEYCF